MKLRKKLQLRMDELQRCMESNEHLTNPQTVIDILESVSFAWSVLSEEDREYIQCAQTALEERLEWNV